MKNLLIYVNPRKCFDKETEILARVQIANSLDLGWKRDDIVVATNFPYEFLGVVSVPLPDNLFNERHYQATKVAPMEYLFKTGAIGDDVYWLHDFDAYQNIAFGENEPELRGYDIGLTDYGRNERWNGGSMFLKKESKDIIEELKRMMEAENEGRKEYLNEEDILLTMFERNSQNISNRAKRLNISYNFGIKQMKLCYEKSIKPIRVLHFHPERKYNRWGRAWDIVTTNANDVGFPLMSNRLKSTFKTYGIT